MYHSQAAQNPSRLHMAHMLETPGLWQQGHSIVIQQMSVTHTLRFSLFLDKLSTAKI